ncbi:uncharacterized protein EAF01_009192 [Botrytis porri]|uniref:Uncharacterized protein n=1 Tax=Botrytis porri TaxID=87229 RepID=A0A4Z1KFI6_9HELO|nr:uncharacterized protein EAF01_009192 [Botrytis porri]KAF7896789.1 hypothetical protein EAF01_009192 [Botrytis porri]TGO84268.1 hypothetical protein BPOR_0526g00080 [Botrytis porri]
MSPPMSIPPSRSTLVDNQPPRPRLENDFRRDSHDSDQGKAAPLPLLYPPTPLPPVILLEGRTKDKVTQRILEEEDLESLEKAKIKEIEESNGWRFTSDTAGKMYLKIQDKHKSIFIACNDFARECKEAIQSAPRADSRVDSKRKGASAPSLSILLTPEKKAQHLKRLTTLLTSKNRHAQYWTVEDLPNEWLKIDNEALCSKEDRAVLIEKVDKKKKALEKSKPGGKVEDGKSKEGHRLPINDVRRTSDDRQRERRQGPVNKFELEGVIDNGMRRSSREKLDGRAHEGRRVPEDELEKAKMISKDRTRIHDTKVDGRIKNIQQAPISGVGKEQTVVEKPRGNTRTEIDETSNEGRRVSEDEAAKTRTAIAEDSRPHGRKELDEKSKGERQVLGDEIAKKKLVPGNRPRAGHPEVDGRLKNTHRAPMNGDQRGQILVEKLKAGSKVEDDVNSNEGNILPNKRHGSAAIDEVGNRRAVAVDKSRIAKVESDWRSKDNNHLLPKKRHGSQ